MRKIYTYEVRDVWGVNKNKNNKSKLLYTFVANKIFSHWNSNSKCKKLFV